MALRVLSGFIRPESSYERKGSVTIDFHPHTVSGNGAGKELKAIGPNEPFNSTPAKIVSLRQVRFTDSENRSIDLTNSDRDHSEGWLLHDEFDSTRKNSVVISWDTWGESRIQEISYMFIGDSGDN